MKFLVLNVDFSILGIDPLVSRRAAYAGVKEAKKWFPKVSKFQVVSKSGFKKDF